MERVGTQLLTVEIFEGDEQLTEPLKSTTENIHIGVTVLLHFHLKIELHFLRNLLIVPQNKGTLDLGFHLAITVPLLIRDRTLVIIESGDIEQMRKVSLAEFFQSKRLWDSCESLREIVEGIDQGNIVEEISFDDLVPSHNRVHEFALKHRIVTEHVLVQKLKIETLTVMSNKLSTVELGSFENSTEIINGTKHHGLGFVTISTLHLHVIHHLSIGILVGVEFPFEEGEGLIISHTPGKSVLV
jgi:hypothetical protein